jgi:hypothetical protein
VVPLWCAYIGALGGDYFPRNRVLVPLLVPLAMLAAVAFARLAAVRTWAGWAGALLAIGLARFDGAWLPTQPVAPPRLMRQTLSHWEWRGVFCGEWLRDAFGAQQPLLALDQIGALPYASKLPCVDMLGLCDRTIATTPIQPWRQQLTGHARGNGPYVLSRRPDLVGFLPPPHSPTPSYESGTQMEGDAAFLDGYRLVSFDVDRFDAVRCDLQPGAPMILHTWLRLRGKLGHGELTGDRATVPAYLLGSYKQPRAYGIAMTPRLDDPQWVKAVTEDFAFIQAYRVLGVFDRATGRVNAHVRVHGDHVLRALALPAGHWRLAAPGLPSGVSLQLTIGGQALPSRDGAWLVDAADGTTPRVDIVCTVAPTVALPLVLHELVFERAP